MRGICWLFSKEQFRSGKVQRWKLVQSSVCASPETQVQGSESRRDFDLLLQYAMAAAAADPPSPPPPPLVLCLLLPLLLPLPSSGLPRGFEIPSHKIYRGVVP